MIKVTTDSLKDLFPAPEAVPPQWRIAAPLHQRVTLVGDVMKPWAESWMNLQSAYDLRKAEQEIAAQIRREVRPLEQAARPISEG
jgi:hypothetical protein